MNNLKHQQVGHVSEETALVVKNYMLNKVQTDLRYWVETRQPYGQRVMRQVFNTRKGVWWNAKPLTTFSDIVVMYHDGGLDLPQQNFTTSEEPVTVDRFMLIDIQSDQLKAFRAWYNFDEVQLDIINKHIYERSTPAQDTTSSSVTTVQHRTQPLSKPAEDSEVGIARQRKAEAEAQIAEERLRGIRLRNDAAELALQERRRKLTDPKPAAPVTLRDQRDAQDAQQAAFKAIEVANELELPQIKGHWDQTTDPDNYTFVIDMDSERALYSHLMTVIYYCEDHPEHVYTDITRLKTLAEHNEVDISELSFIVNPPPAPIRVPPGVPTAAQINAMEKELLK